MVHVVAVVPWLTSSVVALGFAFFRWRRRGASSCDVVDFTSRPPCFLEKYLQDNAWLNKDETSTALQQGRVQIFRRAGLPRLRERAPSNVTDRTAFVFEGDEVFLDGILLQSSDSDDLSARHDKQYTFALWKPWGIEVTNTAKSSSGNPQTVQHHSHRRHKDLASWLARLQPHKARPLGPVGRLDKRTTGLLLATTDGDLSDALRVPNACTKVYEATVRCKDADEPSEEQCAALLKGVQLQEGFAQMSHVRVLEKRAHNFTNTSVDGIPEVHTNFESKVEVGIAEGKFHIVRRALAKVGLPVMQLQRTAIGPLRLESIPGLEGQGDSVLLDNTAVEALWNCVGGYERVLSRRTEAMQRKSLEDLDPREAARLSLWRDSIKSGRRMS